MSIYYQLNQEVNINAYLHTNTIQAFVVPVLSSLRNIKTVSSGVNTFAQYFISY